jgi:hypothetical protein
MTMKALVLFTGISVLLCGCATKNPDVAANAETKAWNASLPADDPAAQVEARARAILNAGQAADYDEALRMAASEKIIADALAGGGKAEPEGQAEMDKALKDAAKAGVK